MVTILSLTVLVFSIVFHEVAHGYVASLLGDPTAVRAKRITLNPLAHVDPVGTVLLPLMLSLTGIPALGWAKPVPVDPAYFRNPRKGMMLVGLAGPASNVLLAVLAGLSYRILHFQTENVLTVFLKLLCGINMVLAVFNMMPIPPLDGSRVVAGFLPGNKVRAYYSLERYGFIIILALLWVGLLDRILWPLADAAQRLLLG